MFSSSCQVYRPVMPAIVTHEFPCLFVTVAPEVSTSSGSSSTVGAREGVLEGVRLLLRLCAALAMASRVEVSRPGDTPRSRRPL